MKTLMKDIIAVLVFAVLARAGFRRRAGFLLLALGLLLAGWIRPVPLDWPGR